MSNFEQEIHGVQLVWDRETGNIIGYVEDSRETEDPPLNSAKMVWPVQKYINIMDGRFHTITWCWSIAPYQGPYLWAHTDAHKRAPASLYGVFQVDISEAMSKSFLIVDGYMIPPEPTNWPGKKTPIEFYFDDSGTTWLGIGAQLNPDGASGSSIVGVTGNVKNTFHGEIRTAMYAGTIYPFHHYASLPAKGEMQQIATFLTDPRPELTKLTTTAAHTFGFLLDKYYGLDIPGRQTYESSYNPISGSAWANDDVHESIAAYWEFDRGTTGDLQVRDRAGTDLGGKQSSPASGNTIAFFGAEIHDVDFYRIWDKGNPDSVVFKTGYLQFVNENDNTVQLGTINYDLGICVFDNEYTYLPLIDTIPISGMSMNASLSSSQFWVKSINFDADDHVERMTVNVNVTGPEMNFTQNPTGIEETTGDQLLDDNAGYVNSIGFYNDKNELVAIGKLNKPIRKDGEHNIKAQVRLDF